MDLHRMGIHQRHGRGFRIDRPNGAGDWLFLIFKTEAVIDLCGTSVSVPPNAGILYAPTDRELYFGVGDTYVNHYVHFGMDESDSEQKLIPSNTVFYLENVSELELILELLSREQISEAANRDRSIDLLLRLLLHAAADGMSFTKPAAETVKHHEELVALRSKMYANPAEFSSVKELSEAVAISMSHFQSLYKTTFGVSCYDDLLTAKTVSAEHMLATTQLSVKEIAALLGFGEETCFMRRFKKRTGLTPSEYRKKQSP